MRAVACVTMFSAEVMSMLPPDALMVRSSVRFQPAAIVTMPRDDHDLARIQIRGESIRPCVVPFVDVHAPWSRCARGRRYCERSADHRGR